MANRKISNQIPLLKPLNSVFFISKDKYEKFQPKTISIEKIGEKAFGLTCLSRLWTLPFIVISKELYSEYKKSSIKEKKDLLKPWSSQIEKVALYNGIQDEDFIIIRSSGYKEGLKERGKFHTTKGKFSDLLLTLHDCLENLTTDPDLVDNEIHLVLQKFINPLTKGHLSNERRCYKDKRDWLGEFVDKRESFQINLRNWRKLVDVKKFLNRSLECNLTANISEILKIPAAWASEQKLRLHYEWVWDGRTIYIVQADQEHEKKGVNPTKLYISDLRISSSFQPECLKKVNQKLHSKYSKIKNVFTYQKLDMPIAPLYILDDQSIINNLAKGNISKGLNNDIVELVKGSLVIRMDILTKDFDKRQLLPRTEEMRDPNIAFSWLITKSAEFKKNVKEDIAFIFHNFIPAVSSAFSYAVPSNRKVQIEALWGLPEGLYYHSHDKYIVDTKSLQVNKLDIESFIINKSIKCKHLFVSPDVNGAWTSKVLKPPYDWKSSIKKDKWIREIALESRRIAEEEKKPLSIMWFVEVISEKYKDKIIPWYHENYILDDINQTLYHRTKTPFDKSLIIRTNEDIERLRIESNKKKTDFRRIRIQPTEDSLLRNKSTLRYIGELAKKINAIIILEGGILSHAYYQLKQTKAIVEVIHPFWDSEGKRELNKLVRDKVSINIEKGGEIVNKTHLSGEFLDRALREKLIEEAFEVLDAIDKKSIVEELADVSEIIDTLLSFFKISRKEVSKKQKQKRDKAGGFKNGLILLLTKNPLPIVQNSNSSNILFKELKEVLSRNKFSIDQQKLIELSHEIEKSKDRRENPSTSEAIIKLKIPIVKDNWIINTPIKINDLESELDINTKISGKRISSKYQIELSISIQKKQSSLFKSE